MGVYTDIAMARINFQSHMDLTHGADELTHHNGDMCKLLNLVEEQRNS
jgi:hypothetical protein